MSLLTSHGAPMITSSTWRHANTLKVRSCTCMIGWFGPRCALFWKQKHDHELSASQRLYYTYCSRDRMKKRMPRYRGAHFNPNESAPDYLITVDADQQEIAHRSCSLQHLDARQTNQIVNTSIQVQRAKTEPWVQHFRLLKCDLDAFSSSRRSFRKVTVKSENH